LLADGGWQLQDRAALDLGAARGVAVREFPLKTGFADYLLFVDRKAIGAVEAKAEGMPLSGIEWQSEKYSIGLPDIPPAWRKPLPFLYESTGVETFFTNGLDPDPRSRRVFAIHAPETLAEWATRGAGGGLAGADVQGEIIACGDDHSGIIAGGDVQGWIIAGCGAHSPAGTRDTRKGEATANSPPVWYERPRAVASPLSTTAAQRGSLAPTYPAKSSRAATFMVGSMPVGAINHLPAPATHVRAKQPPTAHRLILAPDKRPTTSPPHPAFQTVLGQCADCAAVGARYQNSP
jgi:hypothetical protein